MSIVYIKSSEDLYFCYKYNPIIITNVVDNKYIDRLNRESPSFNEEGELISSCYLIRKYKGSIDNYKSLNKIFVVDDKLSKSQLSFNDFKYIIIDKSSLFDSASYNLFIELCKKWANPKKWIDELEYLENLNTKISVKLLNTFYVNSREDVWDYINNIGNNKGNYSLILSLDSNTLWYLFMIKNVVSTNVKDVQLISYFEILKIKVLEGKLPIKYALIYFEIFAECREQFDGILTTSRRLYEDG